MGAEGCPGHGTGLREGGGAEGAHPCVGQGEEQKPSLEVFERGKETPGLSLLWPSWAAAALERARVGWLQCPYFTPRC